LQAERVAMGLAILQVAWDLAGFSKERFILGPGTQVKGHNELIGGVSFRLLAEAGMNCALEFLFR
jgi:hypothetical protein